MRKIAIKIICAFIVLPLSGCFGTIFSNGPRNIALTTQSGESVNVEIITTNGIQEATIPGIISVPASKSSITVKVKDPCYKETTTIIAPKYNVIAFADFLFGIIGTTGYSVDASTGNNWTYDTSASVIANKNKSCKN